MRTGQDFSLSLNLHISERHAKGPGRATSRDGKPRRVLRIERAFLFIIIFSRPLKHATASSSSMASAIFALISNILALWIQGERSPQAAPTTSTDGQSNDVLAPRFCAEIDANVRLTIGLYPYCIASNAVAHTYPPVLTPQITIVSTPRTVNLVFKSVPKPLGYFSGTTISPDAGSRLFINLSKPRVSPFFQTSRDLVFI